MIATIHRPTDAAVVLHIRGTQVVAMSSRRDVATPRQHDRYTLILAGGSYHIGARDDLCAGGAT